MRSRGKEIARQESLASCCSGASATLAGRLIKHDLGPPPITYTTSLIQHPTPNNHASTIHQATLSASYTTLTSRKRAPLPLTSAHCHAPIGSLTATHTPSRHHNEAFTDLVFRLLRHIERYRDGVARKQCTRHTRSTRRERPTIRHPLL